MARGRAALDHRAPLRRHPDPRRAEVVPVPHCSRRDRAAVVVPQDPADKTRFVFVQPRIERPVPKPPDRAEPRISTVWRARASARRSRPTRCRSRAATLPSGSRSSRARWRAAAGPTPIRRRDARREHAARAEHAAGCPSRHRRCSCRQRGHRRRRTARAGDRRQAADRSATRCATCSATCRTRPSTTRAARRAVRPGDSVRHQGRRVRPVDSPLHRAGEAQLVHPLRGDVDEGARRDHVQRAQGRIDHRPDGGRAVGGRRVQQRGVRRAARDPTRRSRCRPSIRPTRRSSPSRSSTTKPRPSDPRASSSVS